MEEVEEKKVVKIWGIPTWIITIVIATLILIVLFSPAIALLVGAVYQVINTGNWYWLCLVAGIPFFIWLGNKGLVKVNRRLERHLLKRQVERDGEISGDMKIKFRRAIKNRIASSDTDYIEVSPLMKDAMRTPPRLEFEYRG